MPVISVADGQTSSPYSLSRGALVTVSTYGVLEYTPDEAPTSNSTWYRVGLVNGRNVFNSSVYIRLTATGGASTADIDANPSETALESLRPAYGIPQTLAGTFTYATLPAASANTGRTAYTSDQGQVYSDGSRWVLVASPSTATVPLGSGTVAIQAAIDAMSSAGGGTVFLQAGTYTLTSALTPKVGVRIVGVMPVLDFTSAAIPDASNVGVISGTILQGNGSFAAFSCNKAALGEPATQNAYSLLGLSNCGFENLAIKGFSRGFDCGATNNPSFWYSIFKNLYFIGCSDWGLWLTGFQHCNFERLHAFSCANGGMYFGNDVLTAILAPGNSTWVDIYSVVPSTNANLARGLVFECVRGTLNEGLLSRIQSNRFNATVVTQSATMVNLSANITVTDGTKFAVNMPVTVSATANGFTQNQIYFVISVAGNVLQLSDEYQGTAKAATGSTATSVVTSGMAAVELVCYPSANITSFTLSNVDVEAGGTAAIVFCGVVTSQLFVGQAPTTAQSKISICMRRSTYNYILSVNPVTTDFDGSSNTSFFVGTRQTGSVQNDCIGLSYDVSAGQNRLNFGSIKFAQAAPDGSVCFLPINSGVGTNVQSHTTSTGPTPWYATFCGLNVNTYTAANATWTLRTITSAWSGVVFEVLNPANNAFDCIINTDGTQTFSRKAGLTSLTLKPGASVTLTATNSGGALFWAVSAIAGTYAAGIITGL